MLALAWRNLWRQRRRSLLTVAAVAFVVMVSLLYYGIGGASINSMYQRLTSQLGHLQVRAAGYRELRDFRDLLIRDAEGVRQKLEAEAPQGAWVGVLEVPALLSGETRARGVLLSGRDWPDALRADWEDDLSAGRFVEAGDLEGVVLGASLAQSLEVALGDEVYAYAPGTESYGAAAYRVVGLLSLDDVNLEARAAYLSLAAAQELAAPGAVTRFELHRPELRQIRDDSQTEATAARLGTALGAGYSVETWRELEPSLVAILKIIDPLMYVVTLIFFVLAGLLVLNTIYLGLIERIREFGVILSLGARGAQVIGMILLESLLLCLSGAVSGLGLGLGLVAYLSRGFSIPGLEAYYASFGLNPVFYPAVGAGQVAFALLFTVATALLAALWPALLAARLEPAEAMRHTA